MAVEARAIALSHFRRNPVPSYPVFASYAQADRQRELERFAKDLREEIRSKLGQNDPTSVIFDDREGVKAGDKLNDEVINA